jgi:hypothetical protein
MMGLMESHDPEQVELAQSWINDFKGSVSDGSASQDGC